MSIISSATTAYANTSNLATQRSASNRVATDANKQPAKVSVTTDSAPSSSTDIVMLSSEAKDVAKTDVSLNNFAPYFAGRDDLPQSFALSNGVTNAQNSNDPSGKQKSFAQVAIDARASMDAQYAAMKATGKPFEYNDTRGDWNTLMGNLDRRSLYAVRSNEGGQFTKDEQTVARTLMGQQESLAMGIYFGPSSKAGSFVDPFNSFSEQCKAGVNFLDNVSSEEKSSVEWASARANSQMSYEYSAGKEGKVIENLDSESPLAKLIMTAMKTKDHSLNRSKTTGFLITAEDLKRQPWFEGFESQLDQVMQQIQDEKANSSMK